MKILKVCFVILQMAVFLLTISCSNSEDSSKKSVLKEKQDKVAEKMTTSIKDPMEKAQMVNKLMDDRNQQIEEGAKE
ncbi:hypothetical protein [Desulforhopalus sp. IMCC35007]|uniref:hypothetical protein n=1 Tax=Desulforhopalus sp. IMCC35007 TaxID=2569543 RepID=UPI0010ADFC42|nr:hypothetical protein [Desulforhopalus sp. IMCC35007]TKB07758.1 hypothetical protein FCL48_15520 [Desulforhopalus sp. IMCC35007]